MGGGQPDTITQVTSKEPNPYLDWWQNVVFGPPGKYPYGNQLQKAMESLFTDEMGQTYEGSRIAPFSKIQQDILNTAPTAAKNSMLYTNVPIQNMLYSNLLGGKNIPIDPNTGQQVPEYQPSPFMKGLLDTSEGMYLDPAQNRELQKYISMAQRPTLEQYDKNVAGNLTSAAQSGRVGSGYNTALLSESEKNRDTAMRDISTAIAAPAYENERARMQAAQQAGGQLQLASVMPMLSNIEGMWNTYGKLGSLGDIEQRQAQALIDESVQKPWWRWTDYINNIANPLVAYAFGSPYGSSMTTTQGGSYGPSSFGTALGAGSSMAGLIGMLQDFGLFD